MTPPFILEPEPMGAGGLAELLTGGIGDDDDELQSVDDSLSEPEPVGRSIPSIEANAELPAFLPPVAETNGFSWIEFPPAEEELLSSNADCLGVGPMTLFATASGLFPLPTPTAEEKPDPIVAVPIDGGDEPGFVDSLAQIPPPPIPNAPLPKSLFD